VSYLNCPVCHLSLRVPRASFMAPEHCPRCIGRRRVATPLFASPLPMRQLVAEEAARAAEAPPADPPQP
jgi:hypothetical protein